MKAHLFALAKYPKRAFYKVQRSLVWQWFGVHKYEQKTARAAWFYTLYLSIGSVAFAYGIGYLLFDR
ncbi:hypothetical protein [Spirosoma flavus]